METEPMERCDNCLKTFPESKIGTHFSYCRRNIKRCNVCREMYDINFEEQHQEEFHKKETCPHCQLSLPSNDFKKHQANCTQKPKYCEYCDLLVPVTTYPNHLKECESRTKPCSKCNKPITNKQYIIHLVSCPGIVEEYKPSSYQEHIQEQRKIIENNRVVRSNFNQREKGKIYSGEQKQPKRQEKAYTPVSYERGTAALNKNSQGQPPVKQEYKQEYKQEDKYAKFDYRNTKKPEPRKEEPVKYSEPIRPPLTKPAQKQPTFTYQSSIPSRSSANKQVKVASNKELLPTRPTKPITTIKNSKSIERQVQAPKREEIERRWEQKPPSQPTRTVEIKQSSNPVQPTRINAPQSKQRVIYQSQTPTRSENTHEEYALASLGLSAEQIEEQMAIMQSMGGKPSSYTFEKQWENPAFVAEQKAIEEELRRKQKR